VILKELSDLELDEVSLVDMPAIKRKFLIVKKQEENMEEKDLTLEDVEAEVEKKISDKGINAIKGALKMLDAYKDEMPPKVKDAIQVLAEAAGYGYPEGYGYAKPKKEEKEETKKAGAKFSKEDKEKIRAIAKQVLALIEEDIEESVQKSEPDYSEIAEYVKSKVKEIRR
jgi:hypothetical protein